MKAHVTADKRHESTAPYGVDEIADTIYPGGERFFDKQMTAALRGFPRERNMQARRYGDHDSLRLSRQRIGYSRERLDAASLGYLRAPLGAHIAGEDLTGFELQQIRDMAFADRAAADDEYTATHCPLPLGM
jgi:hypothetical protein